MNQYTSELCKLVKKPLRERVRDKIDYLQKEVERLREIEKELD